MDTQPFIADFTNLNSISGSHRWLIRDVLRASWP